MTETGASGWRTRLAAVRSGARPFLAAWYCTNRSTVCRPGTLKPLPTCLSCGVRLGDGVSIGDGPKSGPGSFVEPDSGLGRLGAPRTSTVLIPPNLKHPLGDLHR